MDIISYKKTITELTQDLAKLEVYAKNLEMENSQTTLHELNERIKHDRFNLAVLGEFRRGKSTLINALLRTPVLPSDIVPTTASVNRITYDLQPRAKVEYLDGSTQDIPIEDLSDYATQDGDKSDNVREVTVWYPTVYCANNVDIFDTPGLNDSPEMTSATMDVISKMDIAIFTLAANVNFSMSECEFIGEKLLTSNVGRVIFVITRMGGYTKEEQSRIIASVRKRIEKMVLAKAEDVLADRPEELEAFRKKLGDIRIFGVDSLMALEARKNYDPALLEKSGFAEFERAIDELLTRERGRVMLEKQTGAIMKSSNDIFNVIQTRMVPLTMDEAEFNEKCQKAESEIRTITELTEQEKARLDEACKRIQGETRSNWNGMVEAIKGKIRGIAFNLPLQKADLKKKNQQRVTEEIWKNEMAPLLSRELQVCSEQIQNDINEAVGKECAGLDAYAEKVAGHMEEISLIFSAGNQKISLGENVAGVLANYFTLSGGNVMYGWKKAGMKGALVGGLTGAGITAGGSFVAGAIAGLLGLTAAWPVVVACGLIGSVAGLLGGKAIVNNVFWKDEANKFRQEIAEETCRQFDAVLAENNFANMLHDHIAATFDAIKNEIVTNTTGSVMDIQKALQDTRENFAAQKAQVEQKVQTYTAILESLSSITERTSAVREAYGLDEIQAEA